MTRKYRPRIEYKFQLYKDIEEQLRLIEYITYLRKTKQFVTAVRNGLRLIWTLGEGDLSVLFELFPGIQAQFTPKNDSLIEEFRALLREHQTMTPETPTLASNSGGLKKLPAPQIPMPTFDDEDTIVMRRDPNASANTSVNFLDAALGFQKGKDA